MLILLAITALAVPEPTQELWVTLPQGWAEPLSIPGVGFAEGVRELPDGRRMIRVIADQRGIEALRSRDLEVSPPIVYADVPEGYRSAQELEEELRLLGSTPGVRLVQLGASRDGAPILGLHLGAAHGSGAPVWRLLGGHHGDELASVEVTMAIASAVVQEGLLPDDWLENNSLWVVPVVNPDGVAAHTRVNAEGVDLNRNYGWQWQPETFRGGESAFSEPETRAIRENAVYSPPHAGLSFHSGATNIGYVWNYTTEAIADVETAQELASAYTEAIADEAFYWTNGADWYITNGDTTDWSYGVQGTLDFTVEVSEAKTPERSILDPLLPLHVSATAQFLMQSPDVSGRVVDAETGEPVAAMVYLELADGWVRLVNDPLSGMFHRIIRSPRSIFVRAPGYVSQHLPLGSDPIALEPDRVDLSSGRLSARAGEVADLECSPIDIAHPSHGAVRLDCGPGAGLRVPETVPAGIWSVTRDGWTHPTGLIVGDSDPSTPLTVERSTSELVVSGAPFAPGALVLALGSESRAPTIIDPISVTESELRLPLDPLSAATHLVIVSAGQTLFADLRVDDGTTPEDTGAEDAPLGASCACRGTKPMSLTSISLFLLVALSRRRKTR